MAELNSKILLLGLPEAGKTSFLAAFVHTVETSQTHNLKQYTLSVNSVYINAIVQDWLKGKKTERTKITAVNTSNTDVEIHLEKKNTGQRFSLFIPDFFGEIFESQFTDRLIENDYLNLVKDCQSILLFINPEKIKYPTLIEDVVAGHKLANLIDEEDTKQEPSQSSQIEDENEIEPFRVEHSPTQIMLTDLVETHLNYSEKHPMKIALIISAWDTVIKNMPELSPLRWLELNMPLLYQYLITQKESLSVSAYGISALGGNMEDKNEVKRLTEIDNPTNRIIVQHGTDLINDITSPVEWLISNE